MSIFSRRRKSGWNIQDNLERAKELSRFLQTARKMGVVTEKPFALIRNKGALTFHNFSINHPDLKSEAIRFPATWFPSTKEDEEIHYGAPIKNSEEDILNALKELDSANIPIPKVHGLAASLTYFCKRLVEQAVENNGVAKNTRLSERLDGLVGKNSNISLGNYGAEPFLKISKDFTYEGPEGIQWQGTYEFDGNHTDRTMAKNITITLPKYIFTNSGSIDELVGGFERKSWSSKKGPLGQEYLDGATLEFASTKRPYDIRTEDDKTIISGPSENPIELTRTDSDFADDLKAAESLAYRLQEISEPVEEEAPVGIEV